MTRPIRRLSDDERRAAAVSEETLVREEPLSAGRALPLLVSPRLPGLALETWAGGRRAEIEERLLRHGAVLFRGFEVGGIDGLERFLAGVAGGPLLKYTYRSTPRVTVRGNVHTATEYPADQEIPLHNENSYAARWPLEIAFHCVTAAARGGETPLADSRRITARLSPALRERFATKGVRYVRNYGRGLDLSWQETFQTEDPAEVERFCHAGGIELEWLPGERLRTIQDRPALATHPRTGDLLWFNQAHLFHVSSLSPAMREALLTAFGPGELPRHAAHADGTEIDPADLAEIRAAYRAEAVAFPWQEGDVLLADNMLVAHGRNPYEGPRRIVVGMAVETHGG